METDSGVRLIGAAWMDFRHPSPKPGMQIEPSQIPMPYALDDPVSGSPHRPAL